MRDKRIILCDADDTIENLCQIWVTYLNRMYGTTVHSSEIVDWNVSLFFPSLTKEQVYDPIFNKNFWKEINPIDGCYKVLEEINKRDELYIITATNYQTCDTTRILQLLKLLQVLVLINFIVHGKSKILEHRNDMISSLKTTISRILNYSFMGVAMRIGGQLLIAAQS